MPLLRLFFLLYVICLTMWAAPVWAAYLTLSWTDNTTNEEGTAIERRVDTGSYFEIDRVGVDVTTYIDSQVMPGTTYTYRVRAFNTAGFSAYSNEATGTVPVTLPASPSNLTVGAVPGAVLLSWQDNSIDESGFLIERAWKMTGAFSVLVTVPANTVSYRDDQVKRHQTYCYQIRAFGIAGSSGLSNQVCVKTL